MVYFLNESVFFLGMLEFIFVVLCFRNFGGLFCSECLFLCEYVLMILYVVIFLLLLWIEFDLNFLKFKLIDFNWNSFVISI